MIYILLWFLDFGDGARRTSIGSEIGSDTVMRRRVGVNGDTVTLFNVHLF